MHYLNFIDAYLDEKYLYAVSMENVFFRAEKGSVYHAEILGVIKGFQNKGTGKIYAVQYYKNSLYMFWGGTYEVVRYDFNTQKFSYYYPEAYNKPFEQAGGICRVKNDVWILRDTFEKNLCVFSLENCSYSFYDLDISVLVSNVDKEKAERISKERICLVGNKVWRCIAGTDCLYSIDVETKKIEFHKTGTAIDIFAISHDEGGFYFISINGGTVIQWDEDKGVISRKEISGKKQVKAFQDVLHTNRGYILIPCLSDEIKLLSEEEGMIGKCGMPSRFHRMKGVKRRLFFNYYTDKDKVLLFPTGGNGLIEIDKDTLETKYYPVCIPQKEYIRVLLAEGRNIIERETLSLNSYINALQAGRHAGKELCCHDGTIGRQIMKMTEPKI